MVVVHSEDGIVEHVPDDETTVVGPGQQDIRLRGVGLQHVHLVLSTYRTHHHLLG